LPANYFEDFIDKVYSILPPKYAKQLVNSFIGGLNMLTNKKAYYYFTHNQEYANMAYNLYEERGYAVQYINSIDEGVICLSFLKLNPNYHTGSCVWRQIQEDGILRLMTHMLSCMLPKSIIIAYNTDSFTIKHPSLEAIADARDITKHKDGFENMGKSNTVGRWWWRWYSFDRSYRCITWY
jgi:hypothetical protein